jgi:hypothetical protein
MRKFLSFPPVGDGLHHASNHKKLIKYRMMYQFYTHIENFLNCGIAQLTTVVRSFLSFPPKYSGTNKRNYKRMDCHAVIHVLRASKTGGYFYARLILL